MRRNSAMLFYDARAAPACLRKSLIVCGCHDPVEEGLLSASAQVSDQVFQFCGMSSSWQHADSEGEISSFWIGFWRNSPIQLSVQRVASQSLAICSDAMLSVVAVTINSSLLVRSSTCFSFWLFRNFHQLFAREVVTVSAMFGLCASWPNPDI